MAYWDQYGGQIIAWGLVVLLCIGVSIVIAADRPDSPLGAAGAGLALLAALALAGRGVGVWRARKGQQGCLHDAVARLTQRLGVAEGRVEAAQAIHEGTHQRQLQQEQHHHEQIERLQERHERQMERMQAHHDEQLAEILASLAALRKAIRPDDGEEAAKVYDVKWTRRR